MIVTTGMVTMKGNINPATAQVRLTQNTYTFLSTCSIQKAENNELIRDFLLKNADFKLESELLTLPSAESRTNCPSPIDRPARSLDLHRQDSIGAGDRDGGYVAIITRK